MYSRAPWRSRSSRSGRTDEQEHRSGLRIVRPALPSRRVRRCVDRLGLAQDAASKELAHLVELDGSSGRASPMAAGGRREGGQDLARLERPRTLLRRFGCCGGGNPKQISGAAAAGRNCWASSNVSVSVCSEAATRTLECASAFVRPGWTRSRRAVAPGSERMCRRGPGAPPASREPGRSHLGDKRQLARLDGRRSDRGVPGCYASAGPNTGQPETRDTPDGLAMLSQVSTISLTLVSSSPT